MPKFTSADLGKSAIKGTEMMVENEGIITGISDDGWVRLTITPYKFLKPKSEWVSEKDIILFTQTDKPVVATDIGKYEILTFWLAGLWTIFIIWIVIIVVVLVNMSNAIDRIEEQKCSNANVVSPDGC